jgi:hypothetical protein
MWLEFQKAAPRTESKKTKVTALIGAIGLNQQTPLLSPKT